MSRRRRPTRTPKPVDLPALLAMAAESPKGRFYRPDLVIVRESITQHEMFLRMLRKVTAGLAPFDIPGLTEANHLGVAVFQDASVQDALNARPLHRADARPGSAPFGWIFRLCGTWFLFAMMSADKTNTQEENDFTSAVEDAIRRLRPARVATGPGSRLCRNRDHVSAINAALRAVRAKLIVEETYHLEPLDLDVAVDQAKWNKICDDAQADYQGTRGRLTSGIAGSLDGGEWPKGIDTLPLGYTFTTPDSHIVCPDLVWRDTVADVIRATAHDYTVGGDPATTPAEERDAAIRAVIDILARDGWASGKLRSLYAGRYDGDEEQVTVRDAVHHRSLVESLWKWLPTYRSGTYQYRQETTLGLHHGMTHYLGVALIHDRDAEGNRLHTYMTQTLHFGLPLEGWGVSDKVIEQAIDATERRRAVPVAVGVHGGLHAEKFKPLAGLIEWDDATHNFRLSAHKRGLYQLLQRPIASAYRDPNARQCRRGWDKGEGTRIATMRSDVLHTQLARAITDAMETGVPAGTLVKLATLTSKGLGADEIILTREKIEADIKKNRDRSAYARQREIDAGTDGKLAAARDYADQADQLDRKVTELKATLAGVEIVVERSEITTGTEVDLGDIATVLGLLYDTADQAPRALNFALRQLIHEATFQADELVTQGRFTIAVPTDRGPLLLGPIEVVTPNFMPLGQKTIQAVIARKYFAEGVSLRALAEQTMWSAVTMRVWLHTWLHRQAPTWTKGLRTAAVDCPIPETRQALWEVLTGECTGQPTEFVNHIRNCYTDPGREWALSWAADTHVTRRHLVSIVKQMRPGVPTKAEPAGADRAVRYERLLARIGSQGKGFTVQYLGAPRSNSAMLPAILDPVAGWDKPRMSNARKWINLVRCLTCGRRSATHVLRVPEVPEGLLCVDCRRQPSGGLQFPAAYMRMWERMGDDRLGPNSPGGVLAENPRAIDAELALIRGHAGLSRNRATRRPLAT